MEKEKKEHRIHFLVNLAYWLVVLAIIYVVLKYLINLVMPFFIALILTGVSRPLAKLLSAKTKKKKAADGSVHEVPRKISLNKRFAALLSVLLLFIVICGILTLIAIRLTDRGIELVEQVPGLYYNSIQPGIERAIEKAEHLATKLDPTVMDLIDNSTSNIVGTIGSKVTDLSARFVIWVSSLATKIPTLLLNTIICLIATVFLAIDFETYKGFLFRNLPERPRLVVTEFKDSLQDIVWQFLKSYSLIFVITTIEITVGFLIVGQKRALMLGILIAIFDAFPIVGSGMILLPFSVITMITGDVKKGIGLFFVYVVVVVVRQIIEPKIVGKRVGLRPLVTLVCMFVGTKLFGGIGLFALPILAAILTDLNSSGTLHLFKTEEDEAAEAIAESAPASAATEPEKGNNL